MKPLWQSVFFTNKLYSFLRRIIRLLKMGDNGAFIMRTTKRGRDNDPFAFVDHDTCAIKRATRGDLTSDKIVGNVEALYLYDHASACRAAALLYITDENKRCLAFADCTTLGPQPKTRVSGEILQNVAVWKGDRINVLFLQKEGCGRAWVFVCDNITVSLPCARSEEAAAKTVKKALFALALRTQMSRREQNDDPWRVRRDEDVRAKISCDGMSVALPGGDARIHALCQGQYKKSAVFNVVLY